jgi:hypothetical protein
VCVRVKCVQVVPIKKTERLVSGYLDACTCCPSVFIMDAGYSIMELGHSIMIPSRCLWMQLHAPRLQPAYGWSFVLCFTSCSALVPRHGCSFVLCAYYRARFASRAHAGTVAPEGTTFACAPLPCLLMKHLQLKSICCNIRPKQVKRLQHMFATYVYELYNICNIQIK